MWARVGLLRLSVPHPRCPIDRQRHYPAPAICGENASRFVDSMNVGVAAALHWCPVISVQAVANDDTTGAQLDASNGTSEEHVADFVLRCLAGAIPPE